MSYIAESEVTCPFCGYLQRLTMPADFCLWFHECNNCHIMIKPKVGHCCVFCSYGTVPCPPVQEECCHTNLQD